MLIRHFLRAEFLSNTSICLPFTSSGILKKSQKELAGQQILFLGLEMDSVPETAMLSAQRAADFHSCLFLLGRPMRFLTVLQLLGLIAL